MIDEKRKKLVEKVNELRASGLKVKEAVKKVGISEPNYYHHAKKHKTQVVTYNGASIAKRKYKKQQSSDKIALIFGTSEQIREFLASGL